MIKSYLTKNPCYQKGIKMNVKGLMLHSVGCPQPSAKVFINTWNNENYNRACVHGFIDANDGQVYQTLPWDFRGWHAGGTANNTHIGIEMCEPNCIRYTNGSNFECNDFNKAKEAVKRTYNSAVELFANLCDEFNLDPMKEGVIISHSEGNKKGIASNHSDPEHLWNGLGLPYSMDTFRKEVKKKLDEKRFDNKPSAWAEEGVNWAIENKILNGDENGNLRLHSNVTREEFCVMLKNYNK